MEDVFSFIVVGDMIQSDISVSGLESDKIILPPKAVSQHIKDARRQLSTVHSLLSSVEHENVPEMLTYLAKAQFALELALNPDAEKKAFAR